jgi:hypothetical protein
MTEADKNGGIVVHFAYGKRTPKTEHEYRVVALDAEENLYPLSKGTGGSCFSNDENVSVTMHRFGGDGDDNAPLYDKVAYLGVEVKRE